MLITPVRRQRKGKTKMKISNPFLPMDMPDPDVLRVGDCWYMVSTTMFFMPGAPILRSRDLKHWEICSYICDTISADDRYRLKGGLNAYGKGQWATSLCEHNGAFYACFVCHDLGKTFLFRTEDIERSGWERSCVEEVFHDMSFLFWEGKNYLVYGNGEIRIVELNEDLTGVKAGGLRKILFSTPKERIGLRCEGCRAYVRDGKIYLCFIEWPLEGEGNGRRRQVCYRAERLEGPFERKVIFDDDLGLTSRGIAQGPLFDAPDGSWYSILFQDSGAVGRVPFLFPVRWEEGWPIIGENGKGLREIEVPWEEHPTEALIISDSFAHAQDRLPLQLQWNHNPAEGEWSFTERPGYLRLRPQQKATELLDSCGTLTERTSLPECSFTVRCDLSGMKDGMHVGLAAFMAQYGTAEVRKENGKYVICSMRRNPEKTLEECGTMQLEDLEGARPEDITFRVRFVFGEGKDLAYFAVSGDGERFTELGEPLKMRYSLELFVGYRIGVFCYATEELGGYADFRDLRYVGD